MDGYLLSTLTNPEFLNSPAASAIITAIFIWSLAWKGAALWHASKNDEKIWYMALLLINLGGLLEIAYLFFLSKNKITTAEALKALKNFPTDISKTSSKKK